MEKKILIAGGILIGTFVVIISLLLIHPPQSNQIKNMSTQYILTPPPINTANNSNTLNAPKPTIPDSSTDANMVIPIRLDPKNGILLVNVTYSFVGKILKLDPYNTGVTIHLDNASFPVLPVPNSTPVSRIVNSQQIPATFSDIKNGIRVSIIATYNMKKATWKINHIYILPAFQVSKLSSTPATNAAQQK